MLLEVHKKHKHTQYIKVQKRKGRQTLNTKKYNTKKSKQKNTPKNMAIIFMYLFI